MRCSGVCGEEAGRGGMEGVEGERWGKKVEKGGKGLGGRGSMTSSSWRPRLSLSGCGWVVVLEVGTVVLIAGIDISEFVMIDERIRILL